jgi:2,3-bisphosphoglycerate-dependent phosphoglycerate mutase
MTTLLIARHGNTFDPGDTVLRVGKRTDLSLSSSGREQAQRLGNFFKETDLEIHTVFTSSLKRTIETAKIALETAELPIHILQNHMFDEIDYGPDEGKPESEVIARIGEAALKEWDLKATVPPGWLVDPAKIIENWHNFAAMVQHKFPEQTVLVVTSNGIARFAPHLTDDVNTFSEPLKISTGALCCFKSTSSGWMIEYWNKKV